jgi:hypothetical protein
VSADGYKFLLVLGGYGRAAGQKINGSAPVDDGVSSEI